MSETITITRDNKPKPPAAKIDAQDIFLFLGFVALETGTWMLCHAAAFILCGVLFLVAAAFIETSKKRKQ